MDLGDTLERATRLLTDRLQLFSILFRKLVKSTGIGCAISEFGRVVDDKSSSKSIFDFFCFQSLKGPVVRRNSEPRKSFFFLELKMPSLHFSIF